jgi:hypothetical protein
VFCAWQSAGIDETRTVLDGAVLAAAAQTVTPLWPWLPESVDDEPPVPVERPATGWFSYPPHAG